MRSVSGNNKLVAVVQIPFCYFFAGLKELLNFSCKMVELKILYVYSVKKDSDICGKV